MGMNGIDGLLALLKNVRAHLCVKRKNLTDKSQNLTAEEAFYLQNQGAFKPAFLFA